MRSLHSIVLVVLFMLGSGGLHGQQWKQYADSAELFREQKKTGQAIELYNKAKDELEKDSARTNTYAEICKKLAELYGRKREYKKAESLYLEIQEIKERLFGKVHIEYARSCYDLGTFYLQIEQYQKSEGLLIEAMKLQKKLLSKEHMDYVYSCNNLGFAYLGMVDYQKAELFFSEAREIMKKFLGDQDPDYASSCYTLGDLYMQMGQYEKAEPLFLEKKQINERAYGKADGTYGLNCLRLGDLYRSLGQYEKAEGLLIEAKQIAEKIVGKEELDYASCCRELAILYDNIGQYEKAEFLFIEARTITKKVLGDQNLSYAGSCSNLANLYKNMRQFEKSEALHLEARQIFETLYTKEHPYYAKSCNNLANLYTDIGLYEKAEPLYLLAKNVREKTLGKNNLDYAQSCNSLASLYRIIGFYNKAEPLYLEAKAIRERLLGKQHPAYAQSCQNLAILYWNLNMPGKANELFTEALEIQKYQTSRIFNFTSEIEKQAYLKKVANLNNVYLSFITSALDNDDKGNVYDISLFNRNLILSSSKLLRQEIYSSADSSLKRKFNEWIKLREQIAFWHTKPLAKRPSYLANLESQVNVLEKELTRLSAEFKKDQKQSSITWEDIKDQLKPGEAAIEFVKFEYHNGKQTTDSTNYVALLLRKDIDKPQLISLFESHQMAKLSGAGNSSISTTAFYSSNNKSGNAFNLIWQPLEKHLNGITRIYYAPAGVLHRVSFAALPINDREVLSDKYKLVQLNSTALIVNQSQVFIDAADNIQLFGAIQYDVDSSSLREAVASFTGIHEQSIFLTDDDSRGDSWKYLPGTEKEINAIQNLGKNKSFSVRFTSGVAASEERLKALNNKNSPVILHIATHGFFFPDPKSIIKENVEQQTSGGAFKRSENPLFRAGLLFAGANNAWAGKQFEDMEDGILTAYEVSNLYLPNTKLVVLSACETGLGDIQGNEGVYGLQRAFKMAGVENLVMSLWKVPDNTTAEFMQEFYKNIFNKQSISDAFYHAQSIMKNKYRKQPYKWAAWILVR